MDSNASCCCFQAVSKRSRRRKSQDNSVAEIGILDTRILLSAVNDSATLSGTQNSVEIDVLGNDTGMSKSIVSVGNRTNNTNGGMVSSSNGKLTYSIQSVQIKSLSQYTTANNEAIGEITAWHTSEIGYIAKYYAAVSSTIERFGKFLNKFTSGFGTLGTLAGNIGTYFGGYYAAAGKAIGFLASAYGANVGASYTVVIAAAQQFASDAMDFEIALADQWQQVLIDSLNTQINHVPNPKFYGNDTFTYTMSELQMTSMMGMMMMVPVQSTATVSVAANITDYSAMVMNINH